MTPPDSGEREDVKCPHGMGWYRSMCVECTPPTVVLPLSLAQRILAELERVITALPSEDFRRGTRALAAELRARVEGKS